MKKVNRRNSVSKLLVLGIAFLLTFSAVIPAQAQDADPKKGKELFNSLCAACHKRYKKATGPALFGVTERHDVEWIYKWVKNSSALIASGDAEAIAIYEEYNKTPMNAFPQLSNADIDNILAYVNEPKVTVAPPKQGVGASASAADAGSVMTENVMLGILAFVLVILVVVLVLVNKTLKTFAVKSGVELPVKDQRKPLWKAFIENQFLLLVLQSFSC